MIKLKAERNKNYAKEKYIPTGKELLRELEIVTKRLHSNMKDVQQRRKVSEILLSGKNIFHQIWPNEIPLNTENPHSKNEFSGLYAFARIKNNQIDWQYIGISRTIKRRFFGHSKRDRKSSATWAYQIAKYYGMNENHIPEMQKKYIHNCYFTFVQIDCPMLMHIAEAYCVNKFKAKWNSFKTH